MWAKRQLWLATASYCLLAVAIVGPTAITTRDLVAGDGVDLPGTLWIHWWVGKTLASGHFPFRAYEFFHPDGKNFFADTGANVVDALLGLPLQWLFGVPDFLDALNIVILVGNALCMRRLALDLTDGRLAPAWAAGVVFELHPFVLGEVAEGRPTQAMLWFGVLATRAALRLGEPGWRWAAWFGVFAALQGLTYWFTLYFGAIAWLPIVAWQAARRPREVLPRAALAVGIVAMASAPFLVGMVTEMHLGNVVRIEAPSVPEDPLMNPDRWRRLWDGYATVSWVGVVAIGLLAARRTLPWLLGALVTALFAVGPVVGVTEPPLQNFLYQAGLHTVPFLPRLGFPERITAFTGLMLCGALAVALAGRRALVCAGVAGFVLAGSVGRQLLPVAAASFEIQPGNKIIQREGGAVIYLPFGVSERAMLAQTLHGQPLFGGMGEREPDLRPPGFRLRLQNTFIVMLGATLNEEHPPIGYTRIDREAIAKDFRWVYLDLAVSTERLNALGYRPLAKYRRLIEELGEPVKRAPGWAVWDLTKPIPAGAPGLAANAGLATDELDPLGFGPRKVEVRRPAR